MKNPWDVLRGRERLRVVFWIYCVLGAAAVVTFLAVPPPWMSFKTLLVIGIVGFAYFLWAHVSLWTCAFNTQRRPWGYAARTYALVVLVAVAATFVWPYFFEVESTIEVRLIE